MSFELPDILKLRNLIAAAAAVIVEWLWSSSLGVGFGAGSFAAILIVFLVLAWIIEKLALRLTGKRASKGPSSGSED